MILILLGPPGSGKGTQAGNIIKKYNIPQISTGDILREEVKKGSDLGKHVKNIMDSGKLVPDSIIINIIKGRITQEDCNNGFVLDGFPRTIIQADALKALLVSLNLEVDKVINFTLNDNTIVKRLGGRWTCKKCGAVFHEITNPPQMEGKCDACGDELYQRDDQKEEAIRERLEEYRNKTQPLIDYYKTLVIDIDAERSIDQIFEDVVKVLG